MFLCVVTATIEQGQGKLMATTRKYLNHLLQNTGITPACSEEERAAAEDIARIFSNHGFEPEVQEFNASGTPKVVLAALGIALFVGAVLMGIGGVVGIIGLLLTVAVGVVYVLERMGKLSFAGFGASGLSQNVIAYHKASGPLASPRNRPVVVVAHYDSPRADLFSQFPYATYKPIIVKLMPYMMVVPAVLAVIRLLPFPGGAKVVFWLLAIVSALIPLAHAVGVIANRFILPYTSGSICNKSSVAAMLGVMDAVAPFEHGEEFPNDVPFEDYFSEQVRIAQAAEVEAAVASGDLPEEALDEVAGVAAGDQAEAAEDQAGAQDDQGLGATLAGTAALSLDDLEAGQAELSGNAALEATDAMGATAAMAPVDVVAGAAMDAAAAVVDAGAAAADAVQGADDAVAAQASESDSAGATVAMPVVDGDENDERVAEGAAAEHGADEAPADDLAGEPAELEDEGSSEEAEDEASAPSVINAYGNYRYGIDVIRAIGMVPENCAIEYDLTEPEPEPEAEADAAIDEGEPLDREQDDEFADQVDEELPPLEDEFEGYASDEDTYANADDYGFEDYGDYDDDAFAPVPVNHGAGAHPAGAAAGLAETLSAVGARASRFFDGALRKGRSMLDSVTSHGQGDASNEELEHDETSAEASAPTVDASADGSTSVAEDAPVTADAAESGAPESAAPEAEQVADVADSDEGSSVAGGATQRFSVADAASLEQPEAPGAQGSAGFDPDATIAQTRSFPVQDVAATPSQASDAGVEQVETVDSLMAQITAPRRTAPQPAPQNRAFSMVPDPAAPSVNQMSTVNRSSLFDLPDPSTTPVDPFVTEPAAPAAPANQGATPATSQSAFSVISSDQDYVADYGQDGGLGYSDGYGADTYERDDSVFETITAAAPEPPAATGRAKSGKRGLGKLFHRKKQDESSMSDWLGVDDDFDAKRSGRDIGSWDNFEGDDWKGGATSSNGASQEDLRDAVTSMGDDELLGHDIWFVATGASELDNAGIQAFLDTHRDKLRGVFLINLESIGAGEPVMLATEGGEGGKRVLKGDKRIMNLVRRVSGAFHREFASVEMPYLTTDAYRAMSMSLRSLTIAGVEGNHLACSHSEDDLPYRVNEKNVRLVADVVTEVIRRS